MYNVYADDVCIYSDTFLPQNTKAVSPKLTLEKNAAGSFTATLTPQNAGYESLNRLISKVRVDRDGEEIWEGRIIDETVDFWKNRTITCEGELAYLNDTIQPPAEYHDISVSEFLQKLISIHNSKCGEDKQFEVGTVTVRDSNDSIYRYTNYESTLNCIMDKLIDRLGGYLRIRKEIVGGRKVKKLDYISDEDEVNMNSQTIHFGVNLLDYSASYDLTKYATVVIPRGARLETPPEGFPEALEAYTTVESVNGGSIYVVSEEAVKEYGRIEVVVDWDDVTEPENLLKKAKEYLSSVQFEDMVLEVTAIDLNYLGDKEGYANKQIKLLDNIWVISKPHNMEKVFPVTKLEIPLDEPQNATFTLGLAVKTSLTSQNKETNGEVMKKIENMPSKQSVLDEAKRNATDIINSAMNGYITVTRNDSGTEELYISDMPRVEMSRHLWRWNINGLGYSNDGGASYGLAITMDGAIVADYITTGTLKADLIKSGTLKSNDGNVEWILDSPSSLNIKKGSINLGNGVFSVTDNGYLTATSGKIGGFTITDYGISNQYISIHSGGISVTSIEGKFIGTLGYTHWDEQPSSMGLSFSLENECSYMVWGVKEYPDAPVYTSKLMYVKSGLPGYRNNTLYIECTANFRDYPAENLWIDPTSGGFNGGISDRITVDGVTFTFTNGGLTDWS